MRIGQTTKDKSMLGRRDAFHVPAVLAFCRLTLESGDSVVFVDKECTEVRLDFAASRHGVVDPFGADVLPPGTLFWVLIQPELTSNLTHRFDIELPESDTIELEDELEEDSGIDDDWCKTGCDS